MIINLTNNTDSVVTIDDLGGPNINSGSTIDIALTKSLSDISGSNNLIELISNESIVVDNGIDTFNKTDAIKYISLHNVLNEHRDRSGKLRVHQTSRKLGTMTLWTGVGDDISNPTTVGGGEAFAFNHFEGDSINLTKYIDFNTVENETWLHEGYITWCKAKFDTLSLSMVSRATSTATASGTNYAILNGYLVVPIYTVGGGLGEGIVDITSDITLHDGGLVYMPDNDLGQSPVAFWDAEWNTATKRFDNITPAPTGNGRYNMFNMEIVFAQFVRDMPLLDSGFIALDSSDTDQLGHGMRLKMHAETNTTISGSLDHDWAIACTMCLHREKSV